MSAEAASALRSHLNRLPAGPVADVARLEQILIACWTDLDGTGAESTWPSKLRGRLESVRWDPPNLSFRIERHGAVVMGSSRAFLHEWRVNVARGTAELVSTGRFRQVRPNDSRWDAAAAADEILALMQARASDPRLKWKYLFTVF